MDLGLMNTTMASAAAGVSVPTFKKLVAAHDVQPVTFEGSRTKWWKRSDVRRLCGEPAGENA